MVVLGRYRIERAVDGGVTGSVYRGRDTATDEAVAIKEVRRDQSWSARPGELCAATLEAAHRVHASGIASLRQIGVDDGRLLVVSDWLDCEGLDEVIRWTDGRMAPPLAISQVARALELLERAHSHGLLHGDLKLENVVVPRGGAVERAAIVDFGVAALLADSGVGAMGDGLVPNLAYRAPEQLRDPVAISVQVDIYAMGAVLFHLLSGAPPYGFSPIEDVIRGQLETPAPSLAEVVPGLPQGLADAVSKALSKDPAKRFSSAADFLSALAVYEPEAAARRRVDEADREHERTRFHEETTDQHAVLNEADTQTAVPALPEDKKEAVAAVEQQPRRRLGLIVGVGVALAAAAAVALWFLNT